MEKSIGAFFIPAFTSYNLCKSLRQDTLFHKASKVVDVFEFYMYSVFYRYFRFWHVIYKIVRIQLRTTYCVR